MGTVERLAPDDCMRLLDAMSVGRIVFTSAALPQALPVNYRLHGGSIVFRTAMGSRLSAATAGAVVAFEVDQIDANTRSGWSILVVGHARHETDPAAVGRLDRLGIDSWMPSDNDHYVSISCERVTGRRLQGPPRSTCTESGLAGSGPGGVRPPGPDH